MQFDLDHGLAILDRTPAVLRAMLAGLPDEWIMQNEGGDSWSPFDVVGHLIHGEKTDWITRAQIILEHGDTVPFETFDRFAMFEESKGKSLDQLLDEFAELRDENLRILRDMHLQPADFARKGLHPQLGGVNLGQLLATWVVHDLNHIGQIAQTMSRQYRDEVGVWRAYLAILDD